MKKLRLITSVVTAVVLVLISSSFGGKYFGVLGTLENLSFDWRLTRDITDESKKNNDIVIVDIDRDSLQRLGDFMWLQFMTPLNDSLFEHYKVLALGYGIPPPPDTIDPHVSVLDQMAEKVNADVTDYQAKSYLRETLDDLREQYDYDARFIESLQNRPIVLGYLFDEASEIRGSLPAPVSFSRTSGGDSAISNTLLQIATKKWHFLRGYTGNKPAFLNQTGQRAGYINLLTDSDGAIRKAPLFVRHGGKYYMSFPLAMLGAVRAAKAGHINADMDGKTIKQISIGRNIIPFNSDGSAYINFNGVGGKNVDFTTSKTAVFPYYSLADVIDRRVPKSALAGKIVIVSASDSSIRELFPTPINPELPRGEILATQLANFLDGQVLHRPPSAGTYEFIILMVIAVLMAVVFVYAGPAISIGVVAVLIIGHLYFVLSRWGGSAESWAMVPTIFVLLSHYIINSIAGFYFEWRSGRRLQSAFGQYVPAELANKMASSGQEVNMDGEIRDLSILFSDIRNFTSISEQLTPQQLTELMNRMLTPLSKAIYATGGTVDKYIGDAIMAFWNAPLDDPDHGRNAVRAAFTMQKEIQALSDELVKQGMPEMRLGVGIATGHASVGNMGSELRVAYTAMGDTVNLASRTEGVTKFYGCSILVTDETREQCADEFTFRVVDVIRVKGREQPVTLYQPLELVRLTTPEMLAQIEQLEAARQAYQTKQFPAALESVQAYMAAHPGDRLAEIYLERIQEMIQNPPPPDWDGVTNFETK